MKTKLFLIGLVWSLVITGCAHSPATQVIDVPIAVHANKIAVTKCPDLPVITLTPESTWDQRLKSWQASIVILSGCVDARDQIIDQLNK